MQAASLTHQVPVASGGAYSYGSPVNHSGRLQYANPQDLPSFPSTGLKKDDAAASAAASLGWANQKSVEVWKPDKSASAFAAAVLVKDYKMAPTPWDVRRERSSSDGSRAAILAVRSAGIRRDEAAKPAPPLPAASWSNSAATQAVRRSSVSSRATDTQTLDRRGSLRAARGAMASASSNSARSTRPRATSSPIVERESYPDQANASANALSAATTAHRPSMITPIVPIEEGGAVPYTTMNRLMFTSNPPVEIDKPDRKHDDVLHAAALAMAQRMYTQQQKVIDATKQAHEGERPRPRRSSTSSDDVVQPMRFDNLQEAAYRLAQERLAKLQDEHLQNRDLQEYYGNYEAPHRWGSITGKLRRRASSDGAVIEDRKKSEQIRQQMSLFSTKLSEVDAQKRQHDREALLAAAQRNVRTQLYNMDQKVYAEKGKMHPSHLSEWELKAHAAAQARRDAQIGANPSGQVDIGGGKFMDQKEVEEIAAKRVQPLLDEINENAERERERRAAQKLEEEAEKREAETRKARDKEIAVLNRQLKEQAKEEEKAKKQEQKREEKARKEQEKAIKAEQKRHAKEEKYKQKEHHAEDAATAAALGEEVSPQGNVEDTEGEPSQPSRTSKLIITPKFIHTSRHKEKESSAAPPAEQSPTSPEDAERSPTHKVKNWFKTRFSRPRAQSSAAAEDSKAGRTGFIGGHRLTHPDGTGSMTSLENRSASMREVAMAGRLRSHEMDEPGEGSGRAPQTTESAAAMMSESQPEPQPEPGPDEDLEDDIYGISPVSSVSDDERFVDSQQHHGVHSPLTPPRPIRDEVKRQSDSPTRETRFREDLG